MCAFGLAVPATAAPMRQYDGPQIATAPSDDASGAATPDPVAGAGASAGTSDAAEGDAAEGDAVEGDDTPADVVAPPDELDELDAAPLDWRDGPEGDTTARRLRGGVILTGGGLLLLLGSVILGTTDPCRRLAGNGCQLEARRRAALTMGIPGAAILVAGAVLLGFGLHTRRRLRTNLALGATGNGSGGAVVLGGRF